MRVLVTGHNGFIGSVMVDGALKDSEKIHTTGMSTSKVVTRLAVIQPDFCLVVVAMSSPIDTYR